MQRRRQRRCMHHTGAAARFDEIHFVEPTDFVFHADAAVELDEVGADAKEDVLAVIDDFTGAGMLVRRSAATEVGAAFEESDAEAGIGEGAGRGQASETAAGDGYCGLGGSLAHAGFWVTAGRWPLPLRGSRQANP